MARCGRFPKPSATTTRSAAASSAMRTILRIAAAERQTIRALTSASRARALAAGAAGGDTIVLDYELGSRGSEPVWMPDASIPAEFRLRERAGLLVVDSDPHHAPAARLSAAAVDGRGRAEAAGSRHRRVPRRGPGYRGRRGLLRHQRQPRLLLPGPLPEIGGGREAGRAARAWSPAGTGSRRRSRAPT